MKEIILVRIPVELIAKLREANPELEGISATDLVKIIGEIYHFLECFKHAEQWRKISGVVIISLKGGA